MSPAWYLKLLFLASNFLSSFSGQLSHQGNSNIQACPEAQEFEFILGYPTLQEWKSRAFRNHNTFCPQGSWAELGFSSQSAK